MDIRRPEIVFWPTLPNGENLDESKIPEERDLVRGLIADTFCMTEELYRRYPACQGIVELVHCEVCFIDSLEKAVVRVYGVEKPGELGMSVNDALFSYVWCLHPDHQYGWYPDDEEDELLQQLFRKTLDDYQKIEKRNFGSFEDWCRGNRLRIAYGKEADRDQAYNLMIGINKAFYHNDWEV